MASISPTPSLSPSVVPPVSTSTSAPPPSSTTTTSLPPLSSSPPLSTVASPTQLNVNQTGTPSPSASPPPSQPPPAVTPTPQQPVPSPPPPTPIVDHPTSNPPPPPPPPSRSSPPPVSSPPPAPPPTSPPPSNSTPPTSTPPPQNSPSSPTPSEPPTSSPRPTLSVPPPKSSPPPPSTPPINSPPPAASTPPPDSPPPIPAPTPSNAPPSPQHTSTTPPQRAPSPSNSTPNVSPSNSTPNVSPSPAFISLSPPPPSLVSPPSSHNNTSPSAPESSNSPGGNGIGMGGIVAIGVAVGVIMLSLFGLAVWCMKRRRKRALGVHGGYVMPSSLDHSPRADSNFTKAQTTTPLIGSGSSTEAAYSPNGSGGLGNSRSWFAYEELLRATNGFSSQNLLGEGGFGSVYKGCLPDGREVAVKQLKVGGGQGEREFKAEVEIISRIHHRHLVSLVGYCISDNHRLLVYDYVPNNTLHFHLHGEGRPVLDWTMRVKIAAGVARGIAYLHEDCHPRIIHRDIKLSNILVDNNFEAKVSDFGLAKLSLDADTHVTTRVMGTFGYMAPEYASSGKLTEKSDVFSFGVVLLELITGRKAVDASQPNGDESLVQWARPLLGHALANEEFDGLVDPRLEKNYVEGEMLTMIEAAAACVRHSAAKRPRMGQVVRALDGLATADLSNGMRVGESQVYNGAQSAEIRLFRRMAFGNQNSSTDFFNQISLDIASVNNAAS